MSHRDPAKAAETAVDASSRAWRTLVVGLAVDTAVASAMALYAATADGVQWTWDYWRVVALLVGGTAIKALASNLYRRLNPPAVITDLGDQVLTHMRQSARSASVFSGDKRS